MFNKEFNKIVSPFNTKEKNLHIIIAGVEGSFGSNFNWNPLFLCNFSETNSMQYADPPKFSLSPNVCSHMSLHVILQMQAFACHSLYFQLKLFRGFVWSTN